jgi:hypothetical protein
MVVMSEVDLGAAIIFEVLLGTMRQGSNAQYRRVPHAFALRVIDNAAMLERATLAAGSLKRPRPCNKFIRNLYRDGFA